MGLFPWSWSQATHVPLACRTSTFGHAGMCQQPHQPLLAVDGAAVAAPSGVRLATVHRGATDSSLLQ